MARVLGAGGGLRGRTWVLGAFSLHARDPAAWPAPRQAHGSRGAAASRDEEPPRQALGRSAAGWQAGPAGTTGDYRGREELPGRGEAGRGAPD